MHLIIEKPILDIVAVAEQKNTVFKIYSYNYFQVPCFQDHYAHVAFPPNSIKFMFCHSQYKNRIAIIITPTYTPAKNLSNFDDGLYRDSILNALICP